MKFEKTPLCQRLFSVLASGSFVNAVGKGNDTKEKVLEQEKQTEEKAKSKKQREEQDGEQQDRGAE